jgi:hypothetical protein
MHHLGLPSQDIDVLFMTSTLSSAVGVANCTERYAGRKPGKSSSKYDWWKYNASQLVGGLWYSTQAGGKCAGPGGGGGSVCTWRVVEKIKTINATCANEALFTAVRGRDPACFADDFNITSDCFLECFCAYIHVVHHTLIPVDLSIDVRIQISLTWCACYALTRQMIRCTLRA